MTKLQKTYIELWFLNICLWIIIAAICALWGSINLCTVMITLNSTVIVLVAMASVAMLLASIKYVYNVYESLFDKTVEEFEQQ